MNLLLISWDGFIRIMRMNRDFSVQEGLVLDPNRAWHLKLRFAIALIEGSKILVIIKRFWR